MKLQIAQVSSLEKIFSIHDVQGKEIGEAKVLGGEIYSYQVAIFLDEADKRSKVQVEVVSPIKEHIQVYQVKKAFADLPALEQADEHYITKVPTQIPDILMPLSQQGGQTLFAEKMVVLWVEVSVPRGYQPGQLPVSLNLTCTNVLEHTTTFDTLQTMNLEVIKHDLPQQQTVFAQWLHVDCIANAHNVEIYSEEHWELLEKYISTAVRIGINMILTPVVTPSLDIAPGSYRPCTQLLKIKMEGGKYSFDFSLLRRWVSLCKKCGMKYFEISHLFTQWGAAFTPNVIAEVDGKEERIFGWHVKADAPEYTAFLSVMLPELLEFLRQEDVLDRCSFHISDEPMIHQMKAYRKAYNIVKPLLPNCRLMDALSDVEFYEAGLVENPVCSNDRIDHFIRRKVDHVWIYYCCGQFNKVSNRFMAMPSYRNRVIGLQMYKYAITGFLHWGYNFYNSQYSLYAINPYVTTSADGAFSSGDPFSVYPGKNSVIPSLRAFVFREALQDIELLRLLEKHMGKQALVEWMEKEAGMEISFSQYPHNPTFLLSFMNKVKEALAAF